MFLSIKEDTTFDIDYLISNNITKVFVCDCNIVITKQTNNYINFVLEINVLDTHVTVNGNKYEETVFVVLHDNTLSTKSSIDFYLNTTEVVIDSVLFPWTSKDIKITRIGSIVSFSGLIIAGTNCSNSVLFELPKRYRPNTSKHFTIYDYQSGAAFSISIETTGCVCINRIGFAAYYSGLEISLDNIMYRI